MIDVLVPTFGRADRIAEVAENVHDATEAPHRVAFIVEADDQASIDAVLAIAHDDRNRLVHNTGTRNYAGACNTAYRAARGDRAPRYFFAGSDDLRFHPGWDRAALAVMDALDRVEVVGTNDLLNPYVGQGFHATHYLVDRRYLDRDGGIVDEGPGSFMHEGYHHQFTDTEVIGTAKARVRFQPAMDSVVEHLHFLNGKRPHDATYESSYAHLDSDAALYDARRSLWQDLSR